MSTSEKAFGLVKAVLTYQERMNGLEKKLAALSDGLTRLADSHVALRDRVSTIEGYLRGRRDAAAASDLPRIEG
ncbi:hypothetical protein EJC47_00810 [Sphingomonas sp. TF3]|uniref:hypothetical protein n=1 Tax=Pseudomonadota TaxID=1224 RepID=UPI000F864907|nr:hypothetical protein [Sphingomonas sp. TF3]RUN78449.1 hypothetical protein EJC47_00810 [Sphingomonas sp. TF3]